MARLAILTSEFLPFHGGIGTYVRELATASSHLGHDVTVFAPDYGTPDLEATDPASFEFKVCRFAGGLHSVLHYPRFAALCTEVAGRAARQGGFERILAANIPFAETMAATFPLHCREYDVMLHGSDINKEKYSLRGYLFRPARVFARPSTFFVNSNYTGSLLLKRYPRIDGDRVTVTYLGVSPYWFEPPENDDDILASLGIAADRHVIATVARLTPRKGQLTLLQAAAKLPEALRKKISFVLAGSSSGLNDPYVRAIRAAAENARPAQVIMPEGLTDDEIKALYRTSVVFCLPGATRRIDVEGFGLVFLEAAAQGLPAVAGAVGGVPEVVRDGETGLLVPPDDPGKLSAALRRVIEDRPLRDALATQALAVARQFTWDRCARQTFGLP